jgi:hypothetical protein
VLFLISIALSTFIWREYLHQDGADYPFWKITLLPFVVYASGIINEQCDTSPGGYIQPLQLAKDCRFWL